MSATAPLVHTVELLPLDELRPHPRNYREHPDDERDHLARSIREHGLYRNVVVARDSTILAGHGVVEAARVEGLERIPVVRLDVGPDDPRALKILTGDNEIARLALADEHVLAELLAEIGALDDLLGTGFDDDSLGTLVRLLSAEGEPTGDEWLGMPDFEQEDRQSAFRATVHFANEAAAEAFFESLGVPRSTSFWWPASDGLVGSNAGEAWVAES